VAITRLPGSRRASAGALWSSVSLSRRGIAGNPAEDLGERHVRQGITGEVQAVADHDVPPGSASPGPELGKATWSCDSGIATEQHRTADSCLIATAPAPHGTIAGEGHQAREGVQLLGAADQAAGLRRRILAHSVILALTCDISATVFPRLRPPAWVWPDLIDRKKT